MDGNASYYSRFAPCIREYIYREKWNALHPIQEKAAAAILDGKNHVLIAAGTASGKTEAAFFPALTVLEAFFRAGKKPLVLYVSPLKALINDQAKRLEQLLVSGSDAGIPSIPVWRWHGDIESGVKSRFLENPSGVLLITPESLESLLLRRSRELGTIFSGLLFVVIDEVHVFMGSDRGSQLICQLERVESAAASMGRSGITRRIGLSATLGDYDGGRRWLSLGSDLNTSLVEEPGGHKELSLALAYHDAASFHNKGAAFYRAIYEQCRGKRAIIFTNSRLEAEECAASLGSLAKKQNEPDIFQVHHGSVSALLRDEAEEQLKSGEGPRVICATSTLELGIDIGDLDRIIQLGPPLTVSAFVQRLGRSGRRNGRAEMYFGITNIVPNERDKNGGAKNSGLRKEIAALPWELLRSVAVISLYLEEKWIEPPAEKKFPFSLLIHQTLAVLASLGEHGAEALAERMLALAPFRTISAADFRAMLRSLEASGCIGITEEGTLILGLEGERLVNRHNFYAVFPGDETFRVLLEGREIGTVNFAPEPLSVLVVGGKRWIVESVDGAKREIRVAETGDEGSERLWRGEGGGIHRRVAQKIRRLLGETGTEKYPYLDAAARQALENARRIARRFGITEEALIADEEAETDFGGDFAQAPIPSGKTGGENVGGKPQKRNLYLFPWMGSRGIRSVAAVLGNRENKKTLRVVSLEQHELYFRVTTTAALNEFRASLIEVCRAALDPRFFSRLLRHRELPFTDKYDFLLPPQLLTKQYAANMLDAEALEKLITSLNRNFS